VLSRSVAPPGRSRSGHLRSRHGRRRHWPGHPADCRVVKVAVALGGRCHPWPSHQRNLAAPPDALSSLWLVRTTYTLGLAIRQYLQHRRRRTAADAVGELHHSSIQSVGLGYSGPAAGLIDRPPWPPGRPILTRALIVWLAFVGLLTAIGTAHHAVRGARPARCCPQRPHPRPQGHQNPGLSAQVVPAAGLGGGDAPVDASRPAGRGQPLVSAAARARSHPRHPRFGYPRLNNSGETTVVVPGMVDDLSPNEPWCMPRFRSSASNGEPLRATTR
jgi:hypothetical protein